jgi:hypothetical protein
MNTLILHNKPIITCIHYRLGRKFSWQHFILIVFSVLVKAELRRQFQSFCYHIATQSYAGIHHKQGRNW